MFLKMAAGNVVDKNSRGCGHKIWSMSERVYESRRGRSNNY